MEVFNKFLSRMLDTDAYNGRWSAGGVSINVYVSVLSDKMGGTIL